MLYQGCSEADKGAGYSNLLKITARSSMNVLDHYRGGQSPFHQKRGRFLHHEFF